MAEFEHLSKEKMEHVTTGLWEISSSLNGLGSVFQGGKNEIPVDSEEWFGLGQMLKILSQRASSLEDILRCGYDSTAITKGGTEAKFERKKSEIVEKMKEVFEDMEDGDDD